MFKSAINNIKKMILLSRIENEKQKIFDNNIKLSNYKYNSYISGSSVSSIQNGFYIEAEINDSKGKIKEYEEDILKLI